MPVLVLTRAPAQTIARTSAVIPARMLHTAARFMRPGEVHEAFPPSPKIIVDRELYCRAVRLRRRARHRRTSRGIRRFCATQHDRACGGRTAVVPFFSY